jgi:hypothetical protein
MSDEITTWAAFNFSIHNFSDKAEHMWFFSKISVW